MIKNKLENAQYINSLIYANLALIFLVLVFFHLFDVDLLIQNFFYNNKSGWIVNRNDQNLKLFFYIAPKKIITIFYIFIILLKIYFFSTNKWNKKVFFIFTSVFITIISVSMLKQMTNMYCPDSIVNFGSNKPYVKLFEYFPSYFEVEKRGKCFPAGHASGGFALFSLFFVFKKKLYKIIALFFSLSLGWIMGIYQIMKGAHYFSDTVITMMIASLSSLICYRLILLKNKK